MRTAQFSEVEVGSGRLVDLLSPDQSDVSLWDVANSLAGTARFGGHARPFYYNAQHSCVVASYMEDDAERIHALLHDAAEYVLGDMASPVKSAIGFICSDFNRAYSWLTRQAEKSIYKAAGVPLPSEETRRRVKIADLVALATEQRDVMRSPNRWNLPYPPAPRRIIPVCSISAKAMYIDALAECGVKVEYPLRPFVAEPADPKELQNDGDPIRAAALPRQFAPQIEVAA